jgi:hypothetical protein
LNWAFIWVLPLLSPMLSVIGTGLVVLVRVPP